MVTSRAFLRATAVGLTALLLEPAASVAAKRSAPESQFVQTPNVLFMLVDNLGYGELGVYGGGATRGAPTPRIDRLASEGSRGVARYSRACTLTWGRCCGDDAHRRYAGSARRFPR